MSLSAIDIAAFVVFLTAVLSISLYASRKEDTSEDYFLAGRRLTWWLIGFSLIASNISTEQFVGMAGGGVETAGLAIASYEWIAAICLVIVGFFLLPIFLRLGIFTMPEFLEHRYGPGPRTLMAVYMLVAYVAVLLVSVLYSGAVLFQELFGLSLQAAIWLIGLLAGGYTIYGGLKAVVWSDLLQGAALLIGGGVVAGIAMSKVGGLGEFMSANEDQLHMILPREHAEIPWTAMLFGIWIPNLYYWGLNQFITQRSLGAKTLAEGQKGIVFAAFLKLILPFIIVFPGIIAFQLYGDQIESGDQAYPVLLSNLLPGYGLRGILFAALFGAVMSSLDSMLNSSSTIFTMDLYRRYWRPEASSHQLVGVGRIVTGVFVLVACLLAPLPGQFAGVFKYIQMFQGFISPGIVAVFVFGLVFRRASGMAALAAMLLNIPLYGMLLYFLPGMAFLNHMGITFAACVLVMAAITLYRPLPEARQFEHRSGIELTPDPKAAVGGIILVVAIVAIYIIFW